jgi:hypothetical protein
MGAIEKAKVLVLTCPHPVPPPAGEGKIGLFQRRLKILANQEKICNGIGCWPSSDRWRNPEVTGGVTARPANG